MLSGIEVAPQKKITLLLGQGEPGWANFTVFYTLPLLFSSTGGWPVKLSLEGVKWEADLKFEGYEGKNVTLFAVTPIY